MARQFGKYETLETLGEGGMGTVYKARQEGLDRLVALKVMRPDAASPEAFARFEREAKILAQLRHPNIVRLLTMGRDEGQVYFTMDYIDGRPLSALIEQAHGEAQPPSSVQDRDHLLRHVAVVARAVHYAHTQGIIHRDLKPTNVIVDSDGQPMITDFGLARELDAGQTVTAPGSAVGTALYMSPEQAEGDRAKIGPATDVYALGVILYEVLTGRPPFEGETAAAVLYKATTEPPTPPVQLDKRISRDLETICLKCLEKSPRDRYPTAEALAIDLEQYLAGRPIFAPRKHFQRLRRTLRAHAWQLALAGATVVLLILAVTLLAQHQRGGPPGTVRPPPPPPPAPPNDWPYEVLIDTYYDPNDVACIAAREDEVWWGIRGGAYRLKIATGEKDFFPLRGSVRAIARDQTGNWWFAVSDRVGQRVSGYTVRFDGKTWRTYTSKDGFDCGLPAAIVVDAKNRVWFGGNLGASCYDGVQWRTHRWPYARAYRTAKWRGSSQIVVSHMTVRPDGSLWFTLKVRDLGGPDVPTQYFISQSDGEQWQERKAETGPGLPETSACAFDAGGRLWLGTYGAGVMCIDGNNRVTYTQQDGLAGNEVTAIAAERDGTVWIGTSAGVSRFDGTAWQTFTERDGLVQNHVAVVAIDPYGRKWFGTLGGVSCFDGKMWYTYTDNNVLPNNGGWIRAITFDPKGHVWAIARSGVCNFDGQTWRAFREEHGLPQGAIQSVAVDKRGVKWVVAGMHILSFDGATWKTHEKVDGSWPGQTEGMAVAPDDAKWFVTSAGLWRYDGQTWKAFPFGQGVVPSQSGPLRDAMAIDKDGMAWCATEGGVSSFDGTTWRSYTPKDGLSGEIVLAIGIDRDGRKWFTTATWEDPRKRNRHYGSGVSCFDGSTWRTYTNIGPDPRAALFSIASDRHGKIWVGMGRWMLCLEGDAWRRYAVRDWPRNNLVNAIVTDTRGWMWVGSWGGVSCFDGKTWRTWTTKDYLAGNGVTSLAVDLDGSIWVGTTTGLSHIVLKGKQPSADSLQPSAFADK